MSAIFTRLFKLDSKEIHNRLSSYTEERFPLWLQQHYQAAARIYANDNSDLRELAKLENEISGLREVEERARALYGRELDDEELLQCVKSNNTKHPGMWKKIDKLHKLKRKKYGLLRKLFPDKRLSDSEDEVSVSPTPLEGWWCVVIGIDAYSVEPLVGARHDAEAMYEFLTRQLAIPPNNICLLLDKQATREVIISTLDRHLLNNTNIKNGDKRLVYYAGHGTSYMASQLFQKGPAQAGFIEAICPIDRGTHDSTGQTIHDISDREMNQFLKAVNSKWGPENVLIYDCCHSGSAARDGSKAQESCSTPPSYIARRARSLALPNAVPEMLMAAKRNLRWDNQPVLEPDWEPDKTTHVMLAACRRDEQAVEFDGRGLFTEVLLRALRQLKPGECSWEDVLPRIKPLLWFQTPLALGQSGSKLWFV